MYKCKLKNLNLAAPLEKIPLHVRGGEVFPLQFEAVNTVLSRQNDWQLLITMNDLFSASGQVFVDDGVSKDTVENQQYFKACLI